MRKITQQICVTFLMMLVATSHSLATDIYIEVQNDPDDLQVAYIEGSETGEHFFFYPFKIKKVTGASQGVHDLYDTSTPYNSLDDDAIKALVKSSKKPPRLKWEFDDSMYQYSFTDKDMIYRLRNWIRSGGQGIITRDTNPAPDQNSKVSCMEFVFFIAYGVTIFSGEVYSGGAFTADIELEELPNDDLDAHEELKVGDIVLLKVFNVNMDEAGSFVGHSMIYAGNDTFISIQTDHNLYFQTLDHVKRLWATPGEGVYGVKFELFRVKKVKTTKEKNGAIRLSGSAPKPLPEGVEEPLAANKALYDKARATNKARHEEAKANRVLKHTQRHIDAYFRVKDEAGQKKAESQDQPLNYGGLEGVALEKRREMNRMAQEGITYINHVQAPDYSHVWQRNEFKSYSHSWLFDKQEEGIPFEKAPFIFNFLRKSFPTTLYWN